MLARRKLLAVVAGLAALASGCASTGTIQGLVRLGSQPSDSASSTVVTAWPDNAPPPPPLPRSRPFADVDFTAGRFAPTMLIVAVGTQVAFVNKDRVFHVPFSITPGGAFELGRCAPGSRHAIGFDRPGVVEVYCALHPHEQLYVVVAPDRWHTHPKPDGRFAFHEVPFGKYMVRAWSPSRGEITKRVEVAGSAPVVVELER